MELKQKELKNVTNISAFTLFGGYFNCTYIYMSKKFKGVNHDKRMGNRVITSLVPKHCCV